MEEERQPETEPRLSIVVPTLGARHLARLVSSVVGQPLRKGDELIIVGDTADGPLSVDLPRIPADVGTFIYVPYNHRYHAFGHPQINFGMDWAKGDYLVFNDDDDIFTPGAIDSIRDLARQQPISARVPMLFRFVTASGSVLWRDVTSALNIRGCGGHCIVAPNNKEKLGLWTNRYEGDYDFVSTTVNAHAGAAEACPPIISVARPQLWWESVDANAEHLRTLMEIRNECRSTMTRNVNEITWDEQTKWWRSTNRDAVRAYLFMTSEGTVGAGLLRRIIEGEDDRVWITVMVREKHRKMGIGTSIYRYLTCAALVPVWAEIRDDNAASIIAAERAGFMRSIPGVVPEKPRAGVVLMVKPPDVA